VEVIAVPAWQDSGMPSRRCTWLLPLTVLVACGGDSGGAGPLDAGVISDASSTSDATAPSDGGPVELVLPPANGALDYQLGQAYPPPAGVVVVSRDREASPAPGLYNICYVNGFQTQPGERSFWLEQHPDLLLRDGDGEIVIDPDWNEMLLDITVPAKRGALADIVGGWMDGCAAAGFDAIEIDNLDTYSRSNGLIAQDHAVAFMRLLAERAHARGLPIAQKNAAELLGRVTEMRTDFAVVEECNRWNECADFTAVYGDQVYVIEYRRVDFEAGCRDFPELSIVLRDLNLVGPGSSAYVYDGC
jgi:hypothetical protein